MADAARDDESVIKQLTGFVVLERYLVLAVLELGIVELLAERPHTLSDLANRAGLHEPSLRRILRALRDIRFFDERGDGTIALGAVGERFRFGVKGSVRGLTSIEFPQAWSAVAHSIRTGGSAFEHVYGKSFWEHLQGDDRANERFNDNMARRAHGIAEVLLSKHTFPPRARIIDVGGGNGVLLCSILERYPELRGTLFDRPQVVAEAGPRFERAGVSDRVALEGGDFFSSVPAGGDIYLMSQVLHDWDDARAIDILRQCRRAMAPSAQLILVEHVLRDDGAFTPAFMLDVTMLTMTSGGRERTEREWRELLDSSGFALAGVESDGDSIAILSATPR